MKKWLSAVAAIVLLLSAVAVAMADDNVQADTDKRSNLALDLVLVIDESGTMSYPKGLKNDEYGYRHDAAAALISMCDSRFSRVAIVPFSTKVIGNDEIPGVVELKNVGIGEGKTERQDFLNLLAQGNDKNSNLYAYSISEAGDTDLGGALEKAVDILTENQSKNRPVIVFLSDGIIGFSNDRANKERESRERFEAAAEKAKENNVTIYYVALKEQAQLLIDAAEETGGFHSTISKPEDLPVVFNEIFRDLVGSDESSLEASTVALGDNRYDVQFRVPNRSVEEANILLPAGEHESIRLFKPSHDGGEAEPVEFDDRKYLCYSTTYFSVVKVLKPEPVGDWHIEYERNSTLGTNQPDDENAVKANVVFSYDVIPEISFDHEPMHKLEENRINVIFMKDGKPRDDSMLYLGNIQAQMTVMDADGELQDLNLPDGSIGNTLILTSENDRFTAVINMKNLIPDLHSGEYTFVVKTKGDGMDLGTQKSAVVVNLPPEKTGEGKNEFADCEIHDPRRMDYTEEKTAIIDLNEYVREPDGEEVLFDWIEPENNQVLDLVSLEKGILTLKTRNASGTVELKIRAHDADDIDKQETILTIPCKITSIRDQIINNYAVKVTTDDGESVAKGEPYTYKAVLKNGNETVTDEQMLDLVAFNLKLEKKYTAEGLDPDAETLHFSREGNEFTASAMISNNECEYAVTGEILLKDIPLKTDLPVFARSNQPPVLTEGDNLFAYVAIHDPKKEENEYLQEYTGTLDLNTFVKEPDGEKIAFELLASEETPVTEKTLDSNAAKLTLTTMDTSGSETIRIKATDPEKESVTIEIPVQVESIRDTIQENYVLEFVFPELIDKNQDFEIKAYLDNKGTRIDDAELLQIIDTSPLELVFTPGDKSEETREPLGLELDGTGWKTRKHSGFKEGTYSVENASSIREGEIEIRNSDTKGSLGNVPPWIEEEYRDSLVNHFEIEPFLWRQLDEKEYEIDLNQLFGDSANDQRNFGAYILPEKTGDEDPELTTEDWFARRETLQSLPVQADGKLIIPNDKAGNRTILLTDIDSDGQKVCLEYKQAIISQKQEVIILLLEILAAIVALILLIIAWYWLIHRKAWNSQHGEVSITVNHVPKAGRQSFPKRGKQDVLLNSLKIAEVASGQMNADLAAYTRGYKLRAGSDGKVYVMKTKQKKENFSMMIGTAPMNKNTKKLTWNRETTMTIKSENQGMAGSSVLIEIRRESPMVGHTSRISDTGRATVSPIKATGTQPNNGGVSRPRI